MTNHHAPTYPVRQDVPRLETPHDPFRASQPRNGPYRPRTLSKNIPESLEWMLLPGIETNGRAADHLGLIADSDSHLRHCALLHLRANGNLGGLEAVFSVTGGPLSRILRTGGDRDCRVTSSLLDGHRRSGDSTQVLLSLARTMAMCGTLPAADGLGGLHDGG